MNVTNKGRALLETRKTIQEKVPIVTRNRRAEIVIYRLRMGHVGLAGYMNRFKMRDSELCDDCSVPETVQHFLTQCTKYRVEWKIMANKLRRLNVKHLTIECLLGGGSLSYTTRRAIVTITIQYIMATGRLDNL